MSLRIERIHTREASYLIHQADQILEESLTKCGKERIESLISKATRCYTLMGSFVSELDPKAPEIDLIEKTFQNKMSALIFLLDLLKIKILSIKLFKSEHPQFPEKSQEILKSLKDGHKIEAGHLLGEGCFGKVHKIRVNGQEFAEKRILPDRPVDSFFSPEKLKREAAFLLGLNHENIIQLAGYQYASHRLIMQIANRTSLSHNLSSKDIYEEKKFIKIFIDVTSALAYLHELGVSHLDLHLGNILLHQDERLTAILTDFELSSFNPSRASFTRNTQIRSPQIMAAFEDLGRKYLVKTNCRISSIFSTNPESLKGARYRENRKEALTSFSERITEKTDIWSLGICMHACLASGQSLYQLKRIREINTLLRCVNFHDANYLIAALKRHDGPNRCYQTGFSSKSPFAQELIKKVISSCLSLAQDQRPSASEIHAILIDLHRHLA